MKVSLNQNAIAHSRAFVIGAKPTYIVDNESTTRVRDKYWSSPTRVHQPHYDKECDQIIIHRYGSASQIT